ncbi:MAG TPA: histidinol dehydrogenase, partial [Alphaproteobacteria bacterium]|nr:histidinol dehydrogenase [Alphaproteobacteria bacterium]
MSVNIRRLTTRDQRFPDMFAAFVAAKREAATDVSGSVAKILADVRKRGDGALFDYTKKFDNLALRRETMTVAEREIDEALALCDPKTLDALKLAASRIRAFHERQRPRDDHFVDAAGVELGSRWTPLSAVGLYVPGGTAAYPSSVLMNAIPAQVAGVSRVVMTVPAPKGQLNPLVLAAAREAGVHEIY